MDYHICLLVMPKYQPGDPPPEGYLQWHEWASVQHKAGLRQKRCGVCSLWNFPQEMSDQTVTFTGTTNKHGGQVVTVVSPVCLKCAAPDAATGAGGQGR